MKNALLMACRYLAYYRVRTAIIVVCLSAVMFLPLAVHSLVAAYNRIMIDRAAATPLVIGAKGSAYDLVLNTVYFKGRIDTPLTMARAHYVRDSGLARAVPMYVHHTAGGLPIVGTTLDYFDFRGLTPAKGRLPRVLGEVVLGASAARELDLDVGDKLLSDNADLYNPASSYPLLMHVVGVLARTNTADDLVVFADIKTAWVIDGLAHGHVENQAVDPLTVLPGTTERNLILSAAVVQYNEITPENLDSFHFHHDQAAMPLTAVIALPHDAKSATILAARYTTPSADATAPAARKEADFARAVRPQQVIADMMGVVFRVKRSFEAIMGVVAATTVLLLALVVLLSLRLRQGEFRTLHRIGCKRSTVMALQLAEIAILLAASLVLAGALLAAAMWYVVRFDVLL